MFKKMKHRYDHLTEFHKDMTERKMLDFLLINTCAIFATTYYLILSVFVETTDLQTNIDPRIYLLIGPVALLLQYLRQQKLAIILVCIIVPLFQLYYAIYQDMSHGFDMLLISYPILYLIILESKMTFQHVASFGIACIALFFLLFFKDKITLVLLVKLSGVALFLMGLLVISIAMIKSYLNEMIGRNEKLKKQNQAMEKLIQQNALRTELLAMIAHDIKGPSTAFNNLTAKVSYLISAGEYDELKRIGAYFEGTSQKLFFNIHQMLSWVLSQKNELKANPEVFNVQNLIQKTIEKLTSQYPGKVHDTENNIPKDITINSDLFVVQEIFNNVLDNAFKNSNEFGKVRVDYSLSNSNCHTFSITNEGIPVDMYIIDRIRNGYYKKSKSGYGLGVDICFSLIKVIEGEIVYKPLANGTRVDIIIPELERV